MAIGPGARIGPYEVTSLLGEGGMGKVWRARHSALKRDDALKVLPDDLASDPDRLARFQREAQLLASLNHPNIAHVYGLEQADGVNALVMELVEGTTLADRLGPGPLPLDDALPIARQIAEALDAAHEQGIVHRDLKPANIKLRPDGTVKVLDFGLAKLAGPDDSRSIAGARGHLSHSPTLTSPAVMTRVGLILGTAAYMSPEQARGRPVDKRADVWAFGCVLFEMLSGRRTFDGDDVTETLASVVKSEPAWSALPATTPPAVRRLLERCLRKDPARRLRDIADAKLDIDEALTEPAPIAHAAPTITGTRERWLWIAAMCVAVVALAVMTAAYFRRGSPVAPEVRLQIVTPPGPVTDFAMSPDGQTVVFAAVTDGKTELWLRPLGAVTAQRLPATAGAEYPFWSPDGRSIAFFADQKLKRVEIANGTIQTLADAPAPRGGTWGDGTILFAPANISALRRIPAGGGASADATRLETPEHASHRLPVFLPDGRRFLYFVSGTAKVQGVYLGSLDSEPPRRLFESESAAIFSAPDVLLFRRESALMAQRVDLRTFEPKGDPFAVAETVAVRPGMVGTIAVSGSSGSFAYRPAVSARRQFVWLDRAGNRIGTIGEPDDALNGPWQLSPDGGVVVMGRSTNNNLDLWLIDVARGIPRRFVSDPASDTFPLWSPDGARLAFGSSRLHGSVIHDLFVKPIRGPDRETVLLESAENKYPLDWSRDGRFIVYSVLSAKTASDLWVLPQDGSTQAFVFKQTPSDEMGAKFSPDGHWMTYQSNETGRIEIYVERFPGPSRSTLVSTSGGTAPAWRDDGREIIYRGLDDRVMAVPVSIRADSVDAGTPVALFALRPGATFEPTRDGKRFLVNTSLDDDSSPPITVVLNWRHPQ